MSAVVVVLLGVVIVTATPAAAQISGQVAGTTQVPTAPRDRVLPPPTGTSGLKGRVIDAATGAPVARARVRIQGGGGGPRPSAWTDSAGRFTFTDLPAGPYSLTLEKPTYMMGRYPDA